MKVLKKEKLIINGALDHLAEALAHTIELESRGGRSFAFLIDCLIKFGTVMLNDEYFVSALCDFNEVEENIFWKKQHEKLEADKHKKNNDRLTVVKTNNDE